MEIQKGKMSMICFKTKLFKIGSWTIFVLPESASAKLPSRGLVMVEGTINNFPFQAALEPDGKGSHWLKITQIMEDSLGLDAEDIVNLAIKPTKNWLEPHVPPDLEKALTDSPQMHDLWMAITPMARWDWIRWISSAKQLETRKQRIKKVCSMLKARKRRPCCFNRNQCTDPYVSNNGILLKP